MKQKSCMSRFYINGKISKQVNRYPEVSWVQYIA